MKKINIAIVIVATLVLALIMIVSVSFLLLYHNFEIKKVDKRTMEVSENFMFREELWYYPMKSEVIEVENDTIPVGVAGQKYELNFGVIPRKSSITKTIDMGSDGMARVELRSEGDITPYMKMPEKIYLKSEKRSIKITFNGTETGNFTGTLMIRNTIPKNFLAEKIIGII
ncbi:MAG: hypothetical protein JSV92_02635 [archaeon]|nr:MAG: hypothetical protein JSV92_02635 [archaeon]